MSKNAPLYIVNSVATYKAQLTQSLSNQATVCWSRCKFTWQLLGEIFRPHMKFLITMISIEMTEITLTVCTKPIW